jgi:ketosteroid isomerase-like protein
MKTISVARRRASIGLAAALAFLATPAVAQDDPRVAAEIVGLAQAQIDATVARRPVAERMSAISDDYTLFQTFSNTRIDGKAGVVALNTALDAGGGRTLVTQMLNSRVQVYGDTAILTYNTYSINQDREGATSSDQSRVTRVYVRRGARWLNVHTHISRPATPD